MTLKGILTRIAYTALGAAVSFTVIFSGVI